MSNLVSRRGFFGLAAAAVGAVVQDTTSAGRVYDPGRAGRALPPVTAADNDAGIQTIEKRLRCSCGCGLDIYTCRTTDFSCTYSPALHKEVLRLAGRQDGAADHGRVRGAIRRSGAHGAPKRGFNLAGYFVPSIAIVIAAVVLARVLRAGRAKPPPPAPPATPSASPTELDQLRRELDRFDA